MQQASLRTYPTNCEPCRRRKCRCNRVKPCVNCELRGISDECYASLPRIEQGRRSSTRQAASPKHPRQSAAGSRNHTVFSPPTSIDASPYSNASSSSTLIQTDQEKDATNHVHPLSSKAPDTPVRWEDISNYLPSATMCLQIFSFYFDELVRDVSFVDKASLLNTLESLWQPQGAITRQEAAIVFWILTHASLTIPSKHPLRSSSIDLEKCGSQWKEVASALQTPPLKHLSKYEMLLDVALHSFEAMWYTFQSNFEGNWQATGAGIRRAAALHLFSRPRKPASSKLMPLPKSRQEGIIVDTCLLAQKLQIMDRWIAFTDLRPLGIHPSDVEAWQLSSTPTCLRAFIEGIQVNILELGRDFALKCEGGNHSQQQLYQELTCLLKTIDDECTNVISRYTQETPVSLEASLCAQEASAPHAAVLVSWLMASTFIGCSVAMRFSNDEEAPVDIRLASFRCASNLMSLVPLISSLHRNGKQALRISRLSNHLFYALRAVVLTLVGLDVQPLADERPKDEALLLGRSNWTQSFDDGDRSDPSSHSSLAISSPPGFLIGGDPSLLRLQFANSMSLLEEFAVTGSRTSQRALDVIHSVLALHSGLCSTLGWKRGGEDVNPANEEGGKTGTSSSVEDRRSEFAADWSRARSQMMSDNDQSASMESLRGGTTAYQETSYVQSSQTAIDAMLWHSPELDFLNPADVENIIASFTNCA